MEYMDEDLHVTPFYMKSSQIGLNDNDIPVEEYCDNSEYNIFVFLSN